MRLLFASTHGYLEPSSGAALAPREILGLLVARGADCRVFNFFCCQTNGPAVGRNGRAFRKKSPAPVDSGSGFPDI
jgi:hypothetical protein